MSAALGDMEQLPEADCVQDAPHPRFAHDLYGHEAAEARFLDAFNSGRLHHGWMITGPRGVGKATLAWRIAKFLLAQAPSGGMFDDDVAPADTLALTADHPINRRVTQLSEGRLCLIRRQFDPKKGKFNAGISVDDVRKLNSFFQLSAADGGKRVVIVDAADDMNVSAANALLKSLEEPPKDAYILLVCHQPARLLPTIRSRCRELRLGALNGDAMAAALTQSGCDIGAQAGAVFALSEGSVGTALELAHLEGAALYGEIAGLAGTMPNFDRARAIKLAESCAGAQNQVRYDLFLSLLGRFLSRLAKTGAGRAPSGEAAEGEQALLQRLCPDPLAANRVDLGPIV